MNAAAYYKCSECGYEFLSKNAACPRCKSTKLESKDIKQLTELND